MDEVEVKRVDTDLAPIQERQRGELMAYIDSMAPLVTEMEEREEITDEKGLRLVVADGAAINRTALVIERIRKTAKDPWLAGGRAVDVLVNPIKDRFKAAANKGKRLTNQFHTKIAAEEAAEERKREAAHIAEEKRREGIRLSHKAKGHAVREETTPVAPAAPVAHLAHRSPAKTTTTWKATLTDESKVPREYMTIDHVKVNDAVRIWRRQVLMAKSAKTDPPADLVIEGFEIKAHKDVTH